METFSQVLTNFNFDLTEIPWIKIIATIVILTLTQLLRRFLASTIIRGLEKLAHKTRTSLDDELLEVFKPSVSWLVLIAGIWFVKNLWTAEIGAEFTTAIDGLLSYIIIFIIAYVVYRSSSIFGQLIADQLLHTDTELDELLRPLMPKIFQAIAIIVLVIKISEIFLGKSAGALVGLLGGAGITLGLLFKDIIYDWFCTLIIYSDGLYREGDWVGITGVDGFVEIKKIGFRTTTLHISKWGSIMKMPNSQMISGIVDNWSQNPGKELKWGLCLTFKIDNIPAKQVARICDRIQEIPQTIAGLMPSCTVRFGQIEQNARVIEVRTFVNDANLYFDAERNLNLAVLELLEQEGIDFLFVEIESNPSSYKQALNPNSN